MNKAEMEKIRQNLTKHQARTPDPNCSCDCWEKFQRAKAAWKKYAEQLERDRMKLAEIVMKQTDRIMELEEQIEQKENQVPNRKFGRKE